MRNLVARLTSIVLVVAIIIACVAPPVPPKGPEPLPQDDLAGTAKNGTKWAELEIELTAEGTY